MTREAVATRLEFVLEYTRVIDKQLTELIGDCGHLKDQLAYPTAQRLQNARVALNIVSTNMRKAVDELDGTATIAWEDE